MTYPDYLVAGVGAVYLIVGLGYIGDAKFGLALAYMAYGVANAGLLMASRGL